MCHQLPMNNEQKDLTTNHRLETNWLKEARSEVNNQEESLQRKTTNPVDSAKKTITQPRIADKRKIVHTAEVFHRKNAFPKQRSLETDSKREVEKR
jgi:hypothetical protein